MKTIYSYIIYDSLSENFSNVFYAPNDRVAIKMFVQSVKNIAQCDPKDFSLYILNSVSVPVSEEELVEHFEKVDVGLEEFEDKV